MAIRIIITRDPKRPPDPPMPPPDRQNPQRERP